MDPPKQPDKGFSPFVDNSLVCENDHGRDRTGEDGDAHLEENKLSCNLNVEEDYQEQEIPASFWAFLQRQAPALLPGSTGK